MKRKFKAQTGIGYGSDSDTNEPQFSQSEGLQSIDHGNFSVADKYPILGTDNSYNPGLGRMARKYKGMGYNVNSNPLTGKFDFSKDNGKGKGFNTAVSAITGIAGAVENSRLKHDEQLQVLDNMTPKFMTNQEGQGLNNVPAYTMYGGEGSTPYMVNGGPDFLNYPKGVESDTASNRTEDDVPISDPKRHSNKKYGYEGFAHTAFYGSNSIYKTGGSVSSDKAKEILHDGTANGHPLTDKQRKYFGWIAGGSKNQTGGEPVGGNKADAYYGQSATLSYFKDKLNDKLKSKNPEGFANYFKGLQQARGSGKPTDADQYIEKSHYDDYLSPDEVKQTLGGDYDKYINSLKQVNTFNTAQGQRPLYGNIEGKGDVTSLNYGRRFASLQVTPHFGKHAVKANGQASDYSRQYTYDPEQGAVKIQEEGDLGIRPSTFNPVQSPNDITKKQTGGYAIGDEVELTDKQIKALKKQGYDIKIIK